MNRVTELYEQAFQAAESAVAAERAQEREVAMEKFQEAIRIFSRLAIVETPSKRTLIQEQIADFKQRIADLSASKPKPAIEEEISAVPEQLVAYQRHIDRGQQAEAEAHRASQDNDVSNNEEIQLYMQAADEYLEAIKDPSIPPEVSQGLRTKIEKIIEKVTQLQGPDARNANVINSVDDDFIDDIVSFEFDEILSPTKLKPMEMPTNPPRFTDAKPKAVDIIEDNQPKYTADELDVLRRSSVINGRLFQPWLAIDIHEKFSSSEQFVDHDGLLSMSPKQMEKLDKWVRPTSYGTGQPQMVAKISPYVIVQDVVTDCSFVASLCITAAYEMRFQKQLITNIIYPQDSHGIPIVNPGGKYIVKLWANGVPRKVVVDDFLPLGHNGNLLCSCTTTPNELWVSIIEKAYLKVNGGYDFPGSNSGIDLYALTGWIPESISFSDADQTCNGDIIWQRLISAHNFGDCLITISTGDMSKEEAKRVGLVPSHAYAVLNVVETSTNVRLLQVKNPWNRKRWKGSFGIEDTKNWTPELQKEVGFDLDAARQAKDDGLFWIDFPSIQRYFSALFLNWNPELFQYRYTLHKHWPLDLGPQNDTYNLGYNPQYALKFPNALKRKKSCSVWILLTRHVTTVENAQTLQQFLTLHVYKQTNRVYYPNDAYTRGTYSNNPHTLTCLDIVIEEDESPTFILVASQYEKLAPLDYTISVFSTDEPFELTDAPSPPSNRLHLVDEWSATTAGGCPRYSTFLNNPQYQLVIHEHVEHILLTLEAPVHFAINLRLIRDGQRVGSVSKKHLVAQSGEYRPGFCYIEKRGLEPGVYTVVASTFEPNCIGSFSLQVAASTSSFQVFALPPEGHGLLETKCTGKWNAAAGTAVGCSNFGQYLLNPQYLVHLPQKCQLFLRLKPVGMPSPPSLNVSVYQCSPTGQLPDKHKNPTNAFLTSAKGCYTANPCGVRTPLAHVPSGFYLVIPSTFEPLHGDYELVLYSDAAITSSRLR